jgi:hypothetical protein
MHPSDLYPGLAVRLSTTHPETEYKQCQWARVWYLSARRPGAVMLLTWQTRRSAPLPLLVSADALLADGRPAEPPDMPDWARVEAVGV